MDLLRLILFLGLLSRRMLLEILKRRHKVQRLKRPRVKFVKIFKGIVQLFLVIQTLFLNLLPISDQLKHFEMIGLAIYFVGLGTTMMGRLQLGKNWADVEDCQVLSRQSLVTSGIYHYIRHPIYVGDLLLFVGLEVALNSWLVLGTLILIPILIKQTSREEILLSQTFPDYNDYYARTKKFIPFIL